jgi:hypothetical protein
VRNWPNFYAVFPILTRTKSGTASPVEVNASYQMNVRSAGDALECSLYLSDFALVQIYTAEQKLQTRIDLASPFVFNADCGGNLEFVFFSTGRIEAKDWELKSKSKDTRSQAILKGSLYLSEYDESIFGLNGEYFLSWGFTNSTVSKTLVIPKPLPTCMHMKIIFLAENHFSYSFMQFLLQTLSKVIK